MIHPLDVQIRYRRMARSRILAGGPRPLCIPSRDGWMLLIHLSSYEDREGCWRITRFEAGEAVGHTDCTSWESAIEEAWYWGADYQEAVNCG